MYVRLWSCEMFGRESGQGKGEIRRSNIWLGGDVLSSAVGKLSKKVEWKWRLRFFFFFFKAYIDHLLFLRRRKKKIDVGQRAQNSDWLRSIVFPGIDVVCFDYELSCSRKRGKGILLKVWADWRKVHSCGLFSEAVSIWIYILESHFSSFFYFFFTIPYLFLTPSWRLWDMLTVKRILRLFQWLLRSKQQWASLTSQWIDDCAWYHIWNKVLGICRTLWKDTFLVSILPPSFDAFLLLASNSACQASIQHLSLWFFFCVVAVVYIHLSFSASYCCWSHSSSSLSPPSLPAWSHFDRSTCLLVWFLSRSYS